MMKHRLNDRKITWKRWRKINKPDDKTSHLAMILRIGRITNMCDGETSTTNVCDGETSAKRKESIMAKMSKHK